MIISKINAKIISDRTFIEVLVVPHHPFIEVLAVSMFQITNSYSSL